MALPNGAVTRADVGRLASETEKLDNALNQAAIRGNGAELPKTSQLLNELASMNKLNLLQPTDRKRLLEFLQATRANAPVLHISFSTDPSPVFQQGLITWVRQELNPALLLQIGLHPTLGAGAVVRTTNKFFDFGLKQRFLDKRDVLAAKIRGSEAPVAPAPNPVATPQPSPPEATT
jgi:hypothetical protein